MRKSGSPQSLIIIGKIAERIQVMNWRFIKMKAFVFISNRFERLKTAKNYQKNGNFYRVLWNLRHVWGYWISTLEKLLEIWITVWSEVSSFWRNLYFNLIFVQTKNIVEIAISFVDTQTDSIWPRIFHTLSLSRHSQANRMLIIIPPNPQEV